MTGARTIAVANEKNYIKIKQFKSNLRVIYVSLRNYVPKPVLRLHTGPVYGETLSVEHSDILI